MASFTLQSFILRFIFAVVLVLLTYNPSGYSYVDWLVSLFPSLNPYVAIAGLALIVGWIIYIRATMRSLGVLGIIIVLSACACFLWLLFYWGVLTLASRGPIAWIVLIFVAFTLAVGMSWSHIRRRLSGQVDIDDVDED